MRAAYAPERAGFQAESSPACLRGARSARNGNRPGGPDGGGKRREGETRPLSVASTSTHTGDGHDGGQRYWFKRPETGRIGERSDADAGLQDLNARDYDPMLGLFLQPDWFEVTKKGVGTNRYAYSFNDPVNGRDTNGNSCTGQNSGHCERSEKYRKRSESDQIKRETTFLKPASAVTAALGDVDRAQVSQFVFGGTAVIASRRSREFLEMVGSDLYEKNMVIAAKIENGEAVFGLDPGKATVQEIDEAWVRYEQSVVQEHLDALQTRDPLAHRQVVHLGSESIALLREGSPGATWSNPDQALAAAVVDQKLNGQRWDFSNIDHRVMMGFAVTKIMRERYGLD